MLGHINYPKNGQVFIETKMMNGMRYRKGDKMTLIEIVKEIAAVCVVLATIAGGVAVIIKVLNFYYENKAFRKKCENYENQIKETNDKINSAHTTAAESLAEIQRNTDAKLQQINSELCMISYGLMAALDGLHQLNCNGPVTEAREKFDKHINKQAHGEL